VRRTSRGPRDRAPTVAAAGTVEEALTARHAGPQEIEVERRG